LKRAFVYLSALVVGLAGLTAQAQQPAAGGAGAPPATPKSGGRVGVFNVAKVMKDYQKWQYFAKVMNDKRAGAAGDLGKLRSDIATLQDTIQKEPVALKKDELTRSLVEKQRQFEDRERGIRKQLDEESAGHLKQLFGEIQACVKACVEANGYDIVFAYPDATTVEETNSPLYYDLKLRPSAAMPFYVAPAADMTDILVATLNKHFPPPASVTPAGGAQPAPGAPPAGGQPPRPNP
jgi:Skp family chaperone for outer membrane proteins